MVERPVQGDAPERLKAWRASKKLTQAALAVQLGVSQCTVSELESGKAFPSLSLATALRVRCRIATAAWGDPPAKRASRPAA